MVKRYLKIRRTNSGGGYIEEIDNIRNVIDGEFDGAEVGDQILLTLVEMEESEFKNLPEFTGW